MIASSSTSALLFWSWVNQSQNALINYYNRNASTPMSNATLGMSYSTAVASALTVAYGLSSLLQRRFGPARAKQLLKYVAFPSAMVASSLNCYIVRSPEIATGVPLTDANGKNVLEGETSSIAAREGVHSTTMSRALLQAPVYLVPPVLLALLRIPPHLATPMTTYLLLCSFGLGLPATIAAFPQQASIDASKVEERFRDLRDDQGVPYTKFYYNKGL